MKFNNRYFTLASYTTLLALAQAAPVLKTRTHTAPAVTHWITYTTGTTTVTSQSIETASPANNGGDSNPQGADNNQNAAGNTDAQTTTQAEVPQQQDTTQQAQQPAQTTTSSTQENNAPATNAAPIDAAPTDAAPTDAAPTDAAPTTSSTSAPQETTPTQVAETTSSTSSSSTASPTTEATTSSPSTTSSSSTTSSTSTSTSEPSGFDAEILNAHNEKRALHGVQPLAWNNTLAQYASDYAARTFSCDDVKLVHSHGPYGENLAAGYSGGDKPVQAWYDEIKLYDWSSPSFSEATGHFTQLIWKSSEQVGCAKVSCDNSWSQYTICEYSNSRGNVVGTDSKTGKSFFSENVLKPIKDN